MAVAYIEQKSEGWVAGEEAHGIQQLQPATFHTESAAGVLLIACRDEVRDRTLQRQRKQKDGGEGPTWLVSIIDEDGGPHLSLYVL